MRRHGATVALIVIVMMLSQLTVADGVPRKTNLKPIEISQNSGSPDVPGSSGRGCEWTSLAGDGEYQMPVPPADGWNYNYLTQKFSPEVGCTLTTFSFQVHGSAGSDNAGALIHIWKSDGTYPTSLLGLISVDTVTSAWPTPEVIDLSAYGIVPNGDIHVGVCPSESTDTLAFIVDDGLSGTSEGNIFWNDNWYTVQEFFNPPFCPLMEAEFCGPDFGDYDVWVTLNGGEDVAFIGDTNTVEIWYRNAEILGSWGTCFEFAFDCNYLFISDHGSYGYLEAVGDAASEAVTTYNNIDNDGTDSLAIIVDPASGGLASHAKHAVCYTLAFYIPAGQDPSDTGLCIDNIYYPGQGEWWFSDGISYYTPDYQANENSGSDEPDAPAVCFPVVDKVRGFVMAGDAASAGAIGDTLKVAIDVFTYYPLLGMSLPIGIELQAEHSFDSTHGALAGGCVEPLNTAIGAFDIYLDSELQPDVDGMDVVTINGFASSEANGLASAVQVDDYGLRIAVPVGQEEVTEGQCYHYMVVDPTSTMTFIDRYGSYTPDIWCWLGKGKNETALSTCCEDLTLSIYRGDVEIRMNGDVGKAYVGMENVVEFWMQNEKPEAAIKATWEIDIGRNYEFDSTHGETFGYLKLLGGGEGIWDEGPSQEFQIDGVSPELAKIDIVTDYESYEYFPAHPWPTYGPCFSVAFEIDPGQYDLLNGIRVENVDDWKFRDSAFYSLIGSHFPYLNGHKNSVRQAPPAYFDIVRQPGGVDVHLNGGDDVAYIGQTNTLEIWIRNTVDLMALNTPFSIEIGRDYTFDQNCGNLGYAETHGPLDTAFSSYHYCYGYVDNDGIDTVIFQGIAFIAEDMVPINSDPVLCYSLAFDIPADQEPLEDGVVIDNIVNLMINQYWAFASGSETFAPEFQGILGLDDSDPIAPPVTFDIVETDFVCADVNASGSVDIDDVVYLIAYIFSGGPAPEPVESGDANCSGGVDIDDVVYLIAYIFSGGNAPCDPDGDAVPNC